jgi:hypothetical protein
VKTLDSEPDPDSFEMLDPDPDTDPDLINSDPQQLKKLRSLMFCSAGYSPDGLQASVGAWKSFIEAQEEIYCNF